MSAMVLGCAIAVVVLGVTVVAAVAPKITQFRRMRSYVAEIADLVSEGEDDGNGKPFERENDDAWQMVMGFIGAAREVLGSPRDNNRP